MAIAIRKVLKDNYVDVTGVGDVATAVSLKETYTGYPASVNLSDGAVRVSYQAGSSYS